jgi:hypothetical protein
MIGAILEALVLPVVAVVDACVLSVMSIMEVFKTK